MDMPDRALTRTEAAGLLRVSPRTWDRLRARPDFPAGRRLGPGTARWLESELLEWLRAQPAAVAPNP